MFGFTQIITDTIEDINANTLTVSKKGKGSNEARHMVPLWSTVTASLFKVKKVPLMC